MKTNQINLSTINQTFEDDVNSNFIKTQQKKVWSEEQKYQTILSGTLAGGESIEPGTLHGGESIEPGTLHWGGVEWECGNCKIRVTAPHGVTPDPDSGCPYGRHAWYKL